MLPGILLSVALSVQAPDSAHLVLVATTDLHGHVTEWDYAMDAPYPGGLTRAATIIDSLRSQYPDQVVLMDAGDLIEGDLFGVYFSRIAPREPHPVIDLMNGLGYDVGTPGNHDFDDGPEAMVKLLAAARFPYVSGNIQVPGRDTLLYPAYTVVLRRGIRVGVTGFTTTGVMAWSKGQVRGKLRVARVESTAEHVLRELRKDADVVVVLAHTGLGGPSTYDTTGVGAENTAAVLSQGTARPDVVIVGHSHRQIADSVLNGVHFVQPPADGLGLAVVHVDLRRQAGVWQPTRVRAQVVALRTVAISAKVRRRLADVDNAVRIWAAQTVAQSTGAMSAATARAEDLPIMRLVTDIERRHAHADLAATPVFDLRAGFGVGDISNGKVFALYPPEYTLRAVRISGFQLLGYLEQSARYFYSDSTGRVAINALASPLNYDLVGGAQYAIDLSQPPGRRIRDLKVGGRPVQPTDSFTLALDSYRQGGGGNFAMLASAPVVYDRGEHIRDLLLNDLKSRGVIGPEDFGRAAWRIVPPAAASAARALWQREPVAARAAPSAGAPIATSPRDTVRPSAAPQIVIDSGPHTVATIKVPVSRVGARFPLGALLADAYRNVLRADVAIVSRAEARADLPAGKLTQEGAAAVVEPGHLLRKIHLTGADLRWVFENLVVGEEPCCQLSGAIVTYGQDQKDWDRVKDVRRAGTGKRFDPKESYTLVVSDYLITAGNAFPLGASECSAPFGCAKSGLLGRWVVEEGGSSLDAFVAYLRRLPQPVEPPGDLRLVAK
jgi:2',3'-cyclic-nucleotide 2'-phosphodiesterase/3'-nucleotidase